MPQKVRITVSGVSLEAELSDSPCARAITAALPLEATPRQWGDEFYFSVPVEAALDGSATVSVKVGDIGYWPAGRALALFFGPTPLSTAGEPVPAGKVNLVGRVVDDATRLRNVQSPGKIRIEKI